MEARRRRFEELDITRDEINNIGQALQNEDFRKLFVEYCEEVNDPENKKQYQKELTELEKQCGVDITFINPEPGFVIKTSVDGHQKAFINVCKSEKVAKPSSAPAAQEGSRGRQWSLPFSLAPPREDLDKQRKRCKVFDVVFHPDTLSLSEKNADFRRMLVSTALDAVENNCKVKLDHENLKFPKLSFKGLQQAAVVRKKIPNHQVNAEDKEFLGKIPFPADDTWTHVAKSTNKEQEVKPAPACASPRYTTPKYLIKYRHGIDLADFTDSPSSRINATIPKELVVEVDLPLLKSASDVALDVTHKSVSLSCEKPKYKLDLVLPYGVDEDAGNATFDKALRKLTLILPVRARAPLSDVGKEDSGVESDAGGRPEDDSDEKSPSENSDACSEFSDRALVEELPSVVNDDAYRTSPNSVKECDNFLKEDIQYLLPTFTCNTFENMVALTLHVKNVEESSVFQRIVCDGRGVHFTFSSLGGGSFPVNYGMCVVFPEGVRVENESLNVEVWDNNVVAQVLMIEYRTPPTEMLVGTGLHDLKVHNFPDLAHIEKVLDDLQLDTENSSLQPAKVEFCNTEPDELVLRVTPIINEVTVPSHTAIKCDENTENVPEKVSETARGDFEVKNERARRKNVRQFSECTSDEFNGTKIRGILKKRPMRSLSESNADEYGWLHGSMTLSDGMASGSELWRESCDTDSESRNEGNDKHTKKTVRFDFNIKKQIFRANSSILGQRKKNRRKQQNKKRAQERRVSESENSEAESVLERARCKAMSSEEEASNLEDKVGDKCKDKFLKDQKRQPSKPKVVAILKRTSSSDTDEDGIRDVISSTSKAKVQSGSTEMQFEISEKNAPISPQGESSEEERDNKTDDKKMKKKRKGKQTGKASKELDHQQFQSDLLLDLEI